MAGGKKIVFSPKASADIRSIRYYYGELKTGLGDEFFEQVLNVLARVERNPSAYRFVNKNVRRCEPNRFPYYIYFSHSNGIVVLRVRHTKQQPLKRFT